MEVNEAIEFINNGINLSTRNLEKEYLEKMDGIISLLKSLEAENKKLKKDYQKYVKGLLERHRERQVDIQVINNLKKENEAYKGMWEELKKIQDKKIDKNPLNKIAILELTKLKNLEQKYLGGGE